MNTRERSTGKTPPERARMLAGNGRSSRPEPSAHIWTRSSVMLVGRKMVSGTERLRRTHIDLAPFGLAADSLLTQVLRCIPFPAHSSSLFTLSNALAKLKDDPEAKEILRTPPKQLTTWTIKELFAAIDDIASKWPERTRYSRFNAVRSFFQLYQGRLKDGTTVTECNYSSHIFAGRQHYETLDITTASNGKQITTKVLDDFSSLDERNSKSLGNALATQKDILDLCEINVLDHEAVKSMIEEARSAGIPSHCESILRTVTRGGQPDVKTILRLTPRDQLRVIIQLIDRKNLYKSSGRHRIPFVGLNQFDSYLACSSGQRRFELLLSDRFLPRQVVVAHGLTILTLTAVNPEVLYSLTRHNIARVGNYIIVTGLKGRIDGKVEALLNDDADTETDNNELKVDHQRAIRALEALAENAINIERTFKVNAVPLICGLTYTVAKPSFYQFNFYSEACRFWTWHSHDRIELRELRRLAAHVNYLSPGGSLYTVQALLVHKGKATTVEYLNTKVISELYEANIRRFMRKLEATALFCLGRSEDLAPRGLTEQDVQRVLFPVTDAINSKNRVDEWILSNGETELVSQKWTPAHEHTLFSNTAGDR